MKNYYDFSDYIRKIQGWPFVDYASQYLHIAFISYQAGASQNDPKILGKSFYFIQYIHTAYYSQNITLKDIQQLYNDYLNGNQILDQEVPDCALESNSGSELIQTSFIIERKQKSVVQILHEKNDKKQTEQEKKDCEKIVPDQNKKKIIIQEIENENENNSIKYFQQQNEKKSDQNDNHQINQTNTQNNQQIEISIPKIKDIYFLSIEQSQIVKKQQYDEYRKQENEKSKLYSQISQKSQIFKNVICNICLENITSNQYVLSACQHIYHKQCLENLVKAQEELPIKCPNLDCRQEILRDDLENIASQVIMDKLDKFSFNQYLLKNPKIFQCPTRDCKGVYEVEGAVQVCMICQQIFCTRCKKQFHEGICGEESFINVAKEQHYSQCSHCLRWIEKTFGCNHISCPCGYEFCYVCGKQWVKGAECRCIDLPQFRQQIGGQNQQQPNQQNYRNARQIQDGFNLIQLLINSNNNQNNQRQRNQAQNFLQNIGLTFIQRILRR